LGDLPEVAENFADKQKTKKTGRDVLNTTVFKMSTF
jgi:hypothetical protein